MVASSMGYRLILLLVAFGLTLPPSAAAFCDAPQPRLVCAEYFSSPLIIQATLVRSSHEAGTADKLDAYIYSLRVDRVLRGKAPQTVRVYEENSSGSATFNWVPRTDYLLFLFPDPQKNGMWSLDGCGNSGPLSKAAAALADIAKVKSGTNGGGMIHGVVNGPNFVRQNPSSGIHVDAKGAGGLFHAVTNEKGEFQINVPAGKYVVSVNEPGLSYRPFEFTYEDPDNLQIQPGGCGQVQFVDQ
jgi:hypothetical protein